MDEINNNDKTHEGIDLKLVMVIMFPSNWTTINIYKSLEKHRFSKMHFLNN